MKKGFVDLQVNGYLGVDFSGSGLTIEKIAFVTQKMVEQGAAAYCPTVVTSPESVYRENLPLLAKAMDDKELAPHILGIHLEGPFISPVDGARGMHNREWVQVPDIEAYERIQGLANGKIVLVTVAPGLEGADLLIQHIAKSGDVTVSLGHHMATRDDIAAAVKSGARACTHLGNGLPEMIRRHQNPLWAQLSEDSLTGMFITDGHHIPPEFISVALRAKTTERFIVTSDVASIGGMPPGIYETGGGKVVLEENRKIRSIDGNCLAGSSSTMTQCMDFLASLGELSEDELWQVGFVNPLNLLPRRARGTFDKLLAE